MTLEINNQSMKNKNLRILFSALGMSLYAYFVGVSYKSYSPLGQVFLLVSILVLLGTLFSSIAFNMQKLYKLSIILVYFGLIAVFTIHLVIRSGILADIKNPESIVKLIKDAGVSGKLLFIFIQFLQVTFVPIPSTIVTGAGALIYSKMEAVLLSTTGLILGSLFAFFLGRTFGHRLVKWIIGEQSLQKYTTMVKGRDKIILIYMFILPVFPDDVLCLIAGLTDMSYTAFIVVQLISRPLNTAMTAFMVDILKYIPLHGWGLAVWAAIGLVCIILFIYMFKKAEIIEAKMLGFAKKLSGKTNIDAANMTLVENNTEDSVSNNAEIANDIAEINIDKDVLATIDYNLPIAKDVDKIINSNKINIDY